MKGRIETFSSQPESKFPNEANSDILGFLLNSDMIKSTPHSGVLPVLPSIYVCTPKRPQVKMPPNLNVPELAKNVPIKTYPIKLESDHNYFP